jgi:hypothetical protein
MVIDNQISKVMSKVHIRSSPLKVIVIGSTRYTRVNERLWVGDAMNLISKVLRVMDTCDVDILAVRKLYGTVGDVAPERTLKPDHRKIELLVECVGKSMALTLIEVAKGILVNSVALESNIDSVNSISGILKWGLGCHRISFVWFAWLESIKYNVTTIKKRPDKWPLVTLR